MMDIAALWRRFRSNRRGNVLMIFGFALIPMVFATGMGVDYSRAARLRTKLNAIADAAALSAVTQPMMLESDMDKVCDVAKTMFEGQANLLSGLDGPPTLFPVLDPKLTPDPHCQFITHPDGANSRTFTLGYTAQSVNAFGGILNMRTITIGGSSAASAAAPPNMDFYLALDTSPSMALPTTQAGIDMLDTALKCSFACHTNKIDNNYSTSSTSSVKGLIRDISPYNIDKSNSIKSYINGIEVEKIDSKGAYVYKTASVNDTISSNLKTKNGFIVRDLCRLSSSNNKNVCVYNADGSFVDSYWYALNKNVRLRVTDERSAVKDFMYLAQTYADLSNRVYHAGIYTFDHSTKTSASKTIMAMPGPSAPSNLMAVSTAADNIELVTVNDKEDNGCPPISCDSKNKYLFTSFKTILDDMAGNGTTNGILPAKSGHGSNDPHDTPQAYLFLVTDGMSDEYTNNSYGRTRSQMLQAQIAQCNTIKGRGIKIAILYTEYTKESIEDDEPGQRDLVTSAIKDVAPALTACASPELMYTVKTNESISEALRELFTRAVATAHLSK